MNDAPSMADIARSVQILSNGPRATVIVDGADLSERLSGYQIDHRAAQMPFLILLARPGTDLGFDGLAQVAVATDTPPGDVVAAFLADIDPAELEQAAINRDDLGDGRYALTAAILRQLTALAREAH